MSRLFISHTSKNDDWAIALQTWLIREGWSGNDDIFLDFDPERGIVAGQRWARALEDAATRCEAVLFLVSEDWLASKWCNDEYQLANTLNKKLFALLINDIPLERLPGGLTAQWQVVNLKGEPAERFLTVHPRTQHQSPVHIAETGLKSLKRGLEKAGIGAETFELQPDSKGPLGWRAPYRGLEALEPEDAAVFFGRGADIVRGIDLLRGLAARKPPRLFVILGASGAGKSSFMRAGLWPRLLRDDSQWLPLRAIRASRGGAIEGSEGILSALEDVHRRFALTVSRIDLRQNLTTPEAFLALMRELRRIAARRALLSKPPFPLPVLCLDQGEELFATDAGPECEKFLMLARAAIDADEALLLVTIRSDSYGLMQGARVLVGIDQVPLSLGPVPQGEIARIIREPSEVLRRKSGPSAPVLDAIVVERLQAEIAGEADALPLLAFVLQRLMREHAGANSIGLNELNRTGGVAAAIEMEAEAALADAGFGPERAEQREVLRRLFIPRLASIDRESKAPQRRVARQLDLPSDLLPLAHALTQRRLLVVKAASEADRGMQEGAATLEVAHEALLRRWPTLHDLLTEDRDALLLLDGVLLAASDWDRAEAERKVDFLMHRGSRLADALALAARGPDWGREIASARSYLAACQAREAAEREEKEAALAREQKRLVEIAAAQARTAQLQQRGRWTLTGMGIVVALGLGVGVWQYLTNLARQTQLEHGRVNLLAELATSQRLRGNLDSALRMSVHAARLELGLAARNASNPGVHSAIAAAVWESNWRLLLLGHEGSVRSAAFSPDGSRIVTASADKTARIWDATTAKELAVLRGHGGPLNSVAFSPDGSRIATASDDKTARIWDAATAKELAVLRGPIGPLYSITFSPDGSRVVTSSSDNTARIWDVATGKKIATLDVSGSSAVFSPDGLRLLVAKRIYDVANGTEIVILEYDGYAHNASFSPDGSRVVIAASNGFGSEYAVRIFDAANGKELAVLRGHGAQVNAAAFSPDGSRIVSVSHDSTVRIWDAVTGEEIAVMRGHNGYVNAAAFSPDGSRIVTASEDGTARIWDALNATAKGILPEIWKTYTTPVRSVAFSPDGSRILTAAGSILQQQGTARIWDATTFKQILELREDQGYMAFAAFSPDGARVVTASHTRGSDAEGARIWDLATAKQIAGFRGHEYGVNSAVFNPDGTRVVTSSSLDKTARIWDVATAKEIAVLRGHGDAVKSAAFSPDGLRIVTASDDGTARIWDVATAKEIAVLAGHSDRVSSAVFSANGARILTASWDKTARIWDATTAKQITVLRGHGGGVYSAAFSPDELRVVTASGDVTARIWDTASANQIAALSHHTSATYNIFARRAVIEKAVSYAAFSPEGSRIVTASYDTASRVWDVTYAMLSTRELLAETCLRRLPGLTVLTTEEMRLAGFADDIPRIDVCTGFR